MATSRIERDRRIQVQERTESVRSLALNYVGTSAPKPMSYSLPKSQREWAWETGDKRHVKQAKFIDSVMHNYPIQGIILNLVVDHWEIYDGRHRIETLKQYRNNEFRWPHVGGALFRELSPEDQEKFDNRLIPVTITTGATAEQLAEIFIRLNSGKKLSDSDMLWAHREKPFVAAVITHIVENQRLKLALGGKLYMGKRSYLANWAALAAGLMTRNAGNMTNSYLRLFETTNDLKCSDEQIALIKAGVDVYCGLLEQANALSPLDTTKKGERAQAQELRKVGKVAAYFFHEWMLALNDEARDSVVEKWVDVILRLRDDDEDIRTGVEDALTINGAQNLNEKKVKRVVEKVTKHLEEAAKCENEDDEEGTTDDE